MVDQGTTCSCGLTGLPSHAASQEWMPTALGSWLLGSGTHRQDTEPSYQCPWALRATSGPAAGMGVGGGGIHQAHSREGRPAMAQWAGGISTPG